MKHQPSDRSHTCCLAGRVSLCSFSKVFSSHANEETRRVTVRTTKGWQKTNKPWPHLQALVVGDEALNPPPSFVRTFCVAPTLILHIWYKISCLPLRTWKRYTDSTQTAPSPLTCPAGSITLGSPYFTLYDIPEHPSTLRFSLQERKLSCFFAIRSISLTSLHFKEFIFVLSKGIKIKYGSIFSWGRLN